MRAKKKAKQTAAPLGGNCYDENGREFLELCRKSRNPNVEYALVHGVAINSIDSKPMGHCWIEATHKLGEEVQVICLDHSNKHVHSLSKETYYYIGKIDESLTFKYDHDEVKRKIAESGHWGHWELNVDR